jgi:hypothetical protein
VIITLSSPTNGYLTSSKMRLGVPLFGVLPAFILHAFQARNNSDRAQQDCKLLVSGDLPRGV